MAQSPEAPQAGSPFWWFWERGTSLHSCLYRLSGGRIGGRFRSAEIALVDSVGRKSGKHRVHPLICREDGENLVIVASKGGIDRHPAWYLNLMAHPETDVRWHGRKRRVRVRQAEGDERERLWKRMVEVYPDYEDYQRRTERSIPVLVLEPVGAPAGHG
jgi:deazaflavin-dependent oxidoreductase (nitroreductase family)